MASPKTTAALCIITNVCTVYSVTVYVYTLGNLYTTQLSRSKKVFILIYYAHIHTRAQRGLEARGRLMKLIRGVIRLAIIIPVFVLERG